MVLTLGLLGGLPTNGALCDFTIVLANGFRINAHRIILALQSTKFNEMLTNPGPDVDGNTYHENNDDACALEAMLRLLYNDGGPKSYFYYVAIAGQNNDSPTGYLKYLANLYLVAVKYGVRSVQVSSRDSFRRALAVNVNINYRQIVEYIYLTLNELAAHHLRQDLASGLAARAAQLGLLVNGDFCQLLLDVPMFNLSFTRDLVGHMAAAVRAAPVADA